MQIDMSGTTFGTLASALPLARDHAEVSPAFITRDANGYTIHNDPGADVDSGPVVCSVSKHYGILHTAHATESERQAMGPLDLGRDVAIIVEQGKAYQALLDASGAERPYTDLVTRVTRFYPPESDGALPEGSSFVAQGNRYVKASVHGDTLYAKWEREGSAGGSYKWLTDADVRRYVSEGFYTALQTS